MRGGAFDRARRRVTRNEDERDAASRWRSLDDLAFGWPRGPRHYPGIRGPLARDQARARRRSRPRDSRASLSCSALTTKSITETSDFTQ